MSEMWKQGRDPLQGFRIVRLGLDPDRNALYERINQRAQRMFEGGLVDETRACWRNTDRLRARCPPLATNRPWP